MNLRKSVIIVCSIVLTLAVLEVGLRMLTTSLIFSPKKSQVYDERLGWRPDPSLPDIDDNGFRNPSVPDRADIVAIGDSHTYGVNVKSENAWPMRLASMSGKSVYNFGVGGYGPLQYYYLTNRAVRMKPKHIILGLYPSNDFNDVCKMMDESEYWRSWAQSRGYDVGVCAGTSSLLSRLSHKLSSLHVYWMAASAIKRFNERSNFGDALEITDGENKTIIKYLSIKSHMKKMDLSRKSIAMGLAVNEDLLLEMKRKYDSEGIEFSVVLIPSKEMAFYDYLKTNGYKLPADYEKLVANEVRIDRELVWFFEKNGINYLDASPYVVDEVNKSIGAYSPTDDGHPIEAGYEAYARAAYDAINSDKIPENKRTGLKR